MVDCRQISDCAIRLPSDDNKWLSFNICNRKKRVPFVNYDSHIIIKKIATAYEGSIELLPITKKKYISFTKNVKDSTEISNLRNNTKKEFFSYEYIDCADKLQDTRLPSRKSFYSSLTENTVSNRYARANNKYMQSYDPSNLDVSAIAQDSLTGYVREVDLEYPERLNEHVDLPFCPTRDKPNMLLYCKKCEIMYTDSLIYRIECDDVYEQRKRDITTFDTSDYSTNNVYYAVRVDGQKEIKKATGIKSNIVAQTITFNNYTRCLNDEIEMTRQQSCIRSGDIVYTISEMKIVLSPYENKRYVISNSTTTLPRAQYRINL
ncbi:hypothetical protein ALC56_04090 [Trachymyrmex septentrionalis]|uniref:Uncharacterized protein n=1 Tax=Trachymyrmex septentrionalis TaxID=34720 RepID=A0A151JYU9_9HYME|nr:hypothetical protein ALC56_04090 [Trachymyrmex septentrionalis]